MNIHEGKGYSMGLYMCDKYHYLLGWSNCFVGALSKPDI